MQMRGHLKVFFFCFMISRLSIYFLRGLLHSIVVFAICFISLQMVKPDVDFFCLGSVMPNLVGCAGILFSCFGLFMLSS